jgi:hypothetical protein
LRGGADSISPTKKIGSIKLTHVPPASSGIHLDEATATELQLAALGGDDAAELLAACQPFTEEDRCNSSPECSWCKSGAVASACYPASFTARLPAGVFECANQVNVRKDAVKEMEEGGLKSQYFNLKQGITLTLTSDSVDKEFCDPNSDVSLAGYMNGESCREYICYRIPSL